MMMNKEQEKLPLPLLFRQEANESLLAFCRESARDLPWRRSVTPYRVWISEIMLQQTRAEVVRRYYDRFLAELPTPRALAEASDDRLAKLWEGLGYYRRASLMKRAACVIVEKHGGELPRDYASLRALPGFGDYTAAAVASFAYGLRAAAVDGNLLRVLARLFRVEENVLSPKTAKTLREIAYRMLPDAKDGTNGGERYLYDGYAAAEWNQAMMELGAQICLPNTQPKCEKCPLSAYCIACAEGCAERLPIRESAVTRKEENRTVLRVTDGERYLLHRRANKGLLAGLYEFPNREGVLDESAVKGEVARMGFSVRSVKALAPARHVFTHLSWHLSGYEIKVDKLDPKTLPEDFFAPTFDELYRDYSIPGAFAAYKP